MRVGRMFGRVPFNVRRALGILGGTRSVVGKRGVKRRRGRFVDVVTVLRSVNTIRTRGGCNSVSNICRRGRKPTMTGRVLGGMNCGGGVSEVYFVVNGRRAPSGVSKLSFRVR